MSQQTKQVDSTVTVEVSSSADSTPAPVKKVELDLDDAPFLQADEKETAPAEYEAEDTPEPIDEEAAKKRKKKLLLLGAIAAGALVVIAAAIWWFFFRTPPPLPPETPRPEVVVVPSAPAPAEKTDIVRQFAPFIVPVKDGTQTRFLVCKFSAISRDANVDKEVEHQLIPLRDAIYFYLRSKDSPFLLDARNGPEIKKELLSVFNDYLSQGKLEDIVFESYLGK